MEVLALKMRNNIKTLRKARGLRQEDMAKLLTEEYEVDEATALNDCKELATLWREAEIIEG